MRWSTALRSYVHSKSNKSITRLRFKPAPVVLISVLLKPMKVIVNRSKQNLPKLLHQVFLLTEFESPCIELLKSHQ